MVVEYLNQYYQLFFGDRLGKYRAGILSLITCTLLILVSFGLLDIFNTGMFPNIVIGIFSLYLLYLSYNEIKICDILNFIVFLIK
jgi:hypothetical protein